MQESFSWFVSSLSSCVFVRASGFRLSWLYLSARTGGNQSDEQAQRQIRRCAQTAFFVSVKKQTGFCGTRPFSCSFGSFSSGFQPFSSAFFRSDARAAAASSAYVPDKTPGSAPVMFDFFLYSLKNFRKICTDFSALYVGSMDFLRPRRDFPKENEQIRQCSLDLSMLQ